MTATIIFDMRCLQDPLYAERGIAGHARSALLLSRDVSPFCRDARIIGIINPKLAPLPADVVAVADEIRPNAYLPDVHGPTVFLNPSPMTDDQAFIGRILSDPAIMKAVMVHDFIPYEEPARYLAHPINRLDYMSSMVWLQRYNLFLPNSQDTADRTAALFDLRSRTTVVTGVPIAPWLEGHDTPATPRHILTVAGDDLRKNPELAIRAHAGSPVMQQRRINLIITGSYPSHRQAAFRVLAAQAGGDPSLLILPGRVAQEILLAYYREAWCVVTPSRAEGFSMPVIEAMAAGVPSLASNIPAHAALVTDPDLRFDPDDDQRVTALLDRCVEDQVWRESVVAAQAPVWRSFRARDVAARIWSAVAAMAPLPRPAIHGRPARIALLTPLPPSKSGVADYSALLTKSFGDNVALSVFSDSRVPGVAPVTALPHVAPHFDRVVSVMGNSSLHVAIYDQLIRHGGACVSHDARLLGFTMAKYGIEHAAKAASLELGRAVTQAELAIWQEDESLREADFFKEIAMAARPLIFHNRHSVARVQARFGITARFLPFALYRRWERQADPAAARMAARTRLGIDQNQTVIISLGFINVAKGIDAGLRALALLRAADCHLYWVGQAHQDLTEFQTLATELGIADRVHFTDRFFTEAQYRDHLLAADYGLQLRLGSTGNISGALADCIAVGLPTVASEDLADNVDAPSFIRRVPDPPQPDAVAAALISLMNSGNARPDWAEEGAAYCDRHSMRNYAKGLCDLLEL